MAMITTSEGWRSERVFRFTLLVSVLLHLIVGVFAFHTFDMVARMLAVHDKSKDEIVTISSAITIAKKPKPVPVSRPVRSQRPTPRVQPQPRVAPQPQQVAQHNRDQRRCAQGADQRGRQRPGADRGGLRPGGRGSGTRRPPRPIRARKQ